LEACCFVLLLLWKWLWLMIDQCHVVFFSVSFKPHVAFFLENQMVWSCVIYSTDLAIWVLKVSTDRQIHSPWPMGEKSWGGCRACLKFQWTASLVPRELISLLESARPSGNDRGAGRSCEFLLPDLGKSNGLQPCLALRDVQIRPELSYACTWSCARGAFGEGGQCESHYLKDASVTPCNNDSKAHACATKDHLQSGHKWGFPPRTSRSHQAYTQERNRNNRNADLDRNWT